MGQKVNPIGFRVGITEDWKSRWYAPKSAFGDFLVEDFKVRKHIDQKLNRRPPFAAVSDILIERTREEVTITHQDRPAGSGDRPQGRGSRQASRGAGRPDQAQSRADQGHRDQEPGSERAAGGRGDRRAIEKAGELPPRVEDADGSDDAGGRQGHHASASAAGSAGRKSPAAKRRPSVRFR